MVGVKVGKSIFLQPAVGGSESWQVAINEEPFQALLLVEEDPSSMFYQPYAS